eukprot:PhM_4_TR12993/c0_g1_i1/m.67248
MPRRSLNVARSLFVPVSPSSVCYYCGTQVQSDNGEPQPLDEGSAPASSSTSTFVHCRLCYAVFCPCCCGGSGRMRVLPEEMNFDDEEQPVCVVCAVLTSILPVGFLYSSMRSKGGEMLPPNMFLGIERAVNKRTTQISNGCGRSKRRSFGWNRLSDKRSKSADWLLEDLYRHSADVAPPSSYGTFGGLIFEGDRSGSYDVLRGSDVCLTAWRPLNKDTSIVFADALSIPLSWITSVSIFQRCHCAIEFFAPNNNNNNNNKINNKSQSVRVVIHVGVGDVDASGGFTPEPNETNKFAANVARIVRLMQSHKMGNKENDRCQSIVRETSAAIANHHQ